MYFSLIKYLLLKLSVLCWEHDKKHFMIGEEESEDEKKETATVCR